jgi:thioredoxin-related protein
MLKTNPKYLLAFILICFLAYFTFRFFTKKQINDIAKNIPNIDLLIADNQLVKLKTENNKYHYLIFFDSLCDHCQAEAKEIQKNLIAFKNAEITFISTDRMHNIRYFADEYNLKGQPNIRFCQISYEALAQYFGNIGFPTIYVYNTENELVNKISGKTKIKELTKYLN